MVSAKTRAAATHIRRARALKEEGNFSEAIEEYRIAEGFDRSVEVATQEANELLQLIEAAETC